MNHRNLKRGASAIVGFGLLAMFAAQDIGAALIDNSTHGNWIQGGDHIYGNDGYILMNFKQVMYSPDYATGGNSDGSITDLTSLPSYVTGYTYTTTGGATWWGNDPPGGVSNGNPIAALQDPLNPNDPGSAKQVGAYVYLNSPGTAAIELQLGSDVPQSFQLSLYGSSLKRPGQVMGYGVLGDDVILQGAEYDDGVWAVFTVHNAQPNSTLVIDAAPQQGGVYGYISAVAFDSVTVPEPPGTLLFLLGGIGLISLRNTKSQSST